MFDCLTQGHLGIRITVLAFCNERIAVEPPDNPLQVPAQAVALRVQMEHEVARGAIERGHELVHVLAGTFALRVPGTVW